MLFLCDEIGMFHVKHLEMFHSILQLAACASDIASTRMPYGRLYAALIEGQVPLVHCLDLAWGKL